MADTAERSEQENKLGSSKELHTSFGFIIGSMLILVGVKYHGSGTTPFEEHRLIMSIFIMFVLVYGVALLKMNLDDHHHNSNSVPTNYTSSSHHSYTYVFIIPGTIACELLLYLLVTPLGLFLIINAFVFIFAVVLRHSCRQQINNEVADRDSIHKLVGWIKRGILCRSSAPLDRTTHEGNDHTECKSLAYLGINRMHGLFKQMSGRLCSAPASTTTSVEDEGRREVQMSINIV